MPLSLNTLSRFGIIIGALALALPMGCSDDDDASGADAGVGGGGGGGLCDPGFAPCGGDVEGSWTYTDACSDFDYAADIQSACPGASIDSLDFTVDGTLELTGGTVGGGGSWSTTFVGTIPAACASAIGTCSDVETALGQMDENVTVSCTGSGDCSCTYTISEETNLGATYTIDGNIVNAGSTDYEYCVEGDSLTYRPVVADGEPQVTFTLTR